MNESVQESFGILWQYTVDISENPHIFKFFSRHNKGYMKIPGAEPIAY